jgi:hypothetical protein
MISFTLAIEDKESSVLSRFPLSPSVCSISALKEVDFPLACDYYEKLPYDYCILILGSPPVDTAVPGLVTRSASFMFLILFSVN